MLRRCAARRQRFHHPYPAVTRFFDSISGENRINCMLQEDTNHVLRLAQEAFRIDDAAAVRRLLDKYPALKARIHEPIGDFDSQAITRVRSREMLDVLLDAGADIDARSQWWAGGFG